MVKRVFSCVVIATVLAACGTEALFSGEEGTEVEEDLVLSASWEDHGQHGEWKMNVKNEGKKALTLQFNSGKEIEVTIENEDGDNVYTYSADKFFIQAILEKELKPNEEMTWSGSVDTKDFAPGEYTGTFELLVNKINGKEVEQPLSVENTLHVNK